MQFNYEKRQLSIFENIINNKKQILTGLSFKKVLVLAFSIKYFPLEKNQPL